jgi:hypothetical protein
MIGIGAFLLWKSVDFANHWVRENGGSADSNTYRVILMEAIRMYRSAGAILGYGFCVKKRCARV